MDFHQNAHMLCPRQAFSTTDNDIAELHDESICHSEQISLLIFGVPKLAKEMLEIEAVGSLHRSLTVLSIPGLDVEPQKDASDLA